MRPEQTGHSTTTGQSFCGHGRYCRPVRRSLIGTPDVLPAELTKKPMNHRATAQTIPLIMKYLRISIYCDAIIAPV
jgi:hypothetical protein